MRMSSMGYVWSLMGFVTLVRGFLPAEFNIMLKRYMRELWKKFWGPDAYCFFHFQEMDGRRRSNNLYRVVQMHLRAKNLLKDADELYLSQEENAHKISYSLVGDETVTERYQGVKVWWTYSAGKEPGPNGGEKQACKYVLKMRRSDKEFVMSTYMDYVTASAKAYKTQLRDLYLYSCNHDSWRAHTFKHPSTFETLAMDPPAKERLVCDLEAYIEGEKYFKKVGRPWKRGYLLYGPPGSGKSSMIAALANRLKYNIYDLELTQVHDNNQLKMLLTRTTRKSIIVIEDIDCSLDLTGSRALKRPGESSKPSGKRGSSSAYASKVTLSGLLNFTDGLWSCCGNERIIIFTTNHIEKLDPGLLRPGRMDMHIHMSYCNFEIFKVLAMNYLSQSSHPLFDPIEELLCDDAVRMTPAQVTEVLFEHKDDTEMALRHLIEDLERKKIEEEVVLIEDSDIKDDMEPVTEEIPEETADGEKACTLVHCNIKSHQRSYDWLSRQVDLDRKYFRSAGGSRGGRRAPQRGRLGRY